MRRRLAGAAFALVLIAGVGGTIAQEAGRSLDDFDPGAASEPGGRDLALPDLPDPAASEQTVQAYQEALRAYYGYREAGYQHRLGVFAWQSLSTKLIFVVVLLLVLAGIYFAAIQFHAGLRRGERDESELSVSLSEFKVRSPVLGVIILTISLAFFYLYLVHVYPIRDVF